jgi:hypothetical protein
LGIFSRLGIIQLAITPLALVASWKLTSTTWLDAHVDTKAVDLFGHLAKRP